MLPQCKWLLVGLVLMQVPKSPPKPIDTRAMEAAVRTFDGVVGLAARDLLTGRDIRINAEMAFPTASAIKTAVMLEAFHQAEAGTISLDEKLQLRKDATVGGSGVLKGMTEGTLLNIRDLVYLMIVLSDNTATNILVERFGTKQVNARLEGYGLTRTKIFRPTFRDGRPDVHPELEREFGLGMSTPAEMSALMALIAEGRDVPRRASDAMLSILRAQNDRAMIPRYLPPHVDVGNKTGTDAEKLPDDKGRRGAIRTDAAVVTGDGVKYTIAIFVRRGADSRSGVDNPAVLLGATLSKMVFDAFTAQRRDE